MCPGFLVDGSEKAEPGGDNRQLLYFDGEKSLMLEVGDGALIPVKRDSCSVLGGFLCEEVLLVTGTVKAVPGIWSTGDLTGMLLVASSDKDVTLEPGHAAGEVRAGLVEASICKCGIMDTKFVLPKADQRCELCGAAGLKALDSCEGCGSRQRAAVQGLQGCNGGRGAELGYSLVGARGSHSGDDPRLLGRAQGQRSCCYRLRCVHVLGFSSVSWMVGLQGWCVLYWLVRRAGFRAAGSHQQPSLLDVAVQEGRCQLAHVGYMGYQETSSVVGGTLRSASLQGCCLLQQEGARLGRLVAW